MRKYGEEVYEPQRFSLRCIEVEPRGQWVDVVLALQLTEGETMPLGLIDPAVLAVCLPEGDVVQVSLLDEGCDSEYQLLPQEEQFVREYVHEHCAALIRSANASTRG
jgi:hypothetical protein